MFNILEKFFPPSPYHKQNLPALYQGVSSVHACNFVVWAPIRALKTERFQKYFLTEISLRLAQESSQAITFWLRDHSIKSVTLRDRVLAQSSRSEPEKIAALIRIREQSEVDANNLLKDLQAKGYRVAAYKVKNSVPLDYKKSWENGVQSPGLVSVSFFRKRKNISEDFFQEYWFCSHTPFAIEIHPLWKYERNVLQNVLTPDAPDFQGIVPLHVKHDSDLSFSRFFSHNGKSALANALCIQADVKRFIDLSTIETVAMREYVLR